MSTRLTEKQMESLRAMSAPSVLEVLSHIDDETDIGLVLSQISLALDTQIREYTTLVLLAQRDELGNVTDRARVVEDLIHVASEALLDALEAWQALFPAPIAEGF